MPGTLHLKAHEGVRSVVKRAAKEKVVAAICAAPTVLADMGLLEGKEATCYPGMEKDMCKAVLPGGEGSTVGKHHYRKRAGHCN